MEKFEEVGMEDIKFLMDRYASVSTSIVRLEAKSNSRDNNLEVSKEMENIVLEIVMQSADGHRGQLQSGMWLWPAAKLLCEYIMEMFLTWFNGDCENEICSRLRVLEVGCGVGLPSLCILNMAKKYKKYVDVVSTDRDTNVLNVLVENGRLNGISCEDLSVDAGTISSDNFATLSVSVLDWGKSLPVQCDLIIGADCIFLESATYDLFKTISGTLSYNSFSQFILCTSIKMIDSDSTDRIFKECCKLYNFSHKILKDDRNIGGCRLEIFSRIL